MARLATLLLLAPAGLLLACGLLLPLLRLALLSFSAPAGAMSAYRALLFDPVYHRVFFNTAAYAAASTAIAVTAGYVLAFTLARLSPSRRRVLFLAVLLPLWVSVLVRSFAWMLILGRNGPVNGVLQALGAPGPLPLLFNGFSVLLGMVHLLLPYAVLPIYAALARIDPALLRASAGLGAAPWRSFRRVLLPLSAQGVATGAAFVFLLALGFFITPALLGGPADITLSMLIESFVDERLEWPLAAAASFVLLAATLGLLGLAGRLVTPATVAEAR